MLVEIIRELTKYEENTTIHSKNLLISSLGSKFFDAIIHRDVKHTDKRPTTNTFSMRRRCKCCGQEYKLR